MKINQSSIKSPSMLAVSHRRQGEKLLKEIDIHFIRLSESEMRLLAPKLFSDMQCGFIDEGTGKELQFAARLSTFHYVLRGNDYENVKIRLEEIA